MKRRGFVLAATAATLSGGLALWFRAYGRGRDVPAQRKRLVRDPAGVLDLPAGFSYRVLERFGAPMNDGFRVAARPDAMGCFPGPNGSLILMRNHELDRSALAAGPYPPGVGAPPEAYDSFSPGCVTRLVLDANGRRVSSNLVLTGTSRNCAGGVSPWGWLSCEETVEPGHGYVFLCSTAADRVRPPQRITAYGRFQHEAVAIDPQTHTAYLTEDRPDGCLYRFVPEQPDKPFERGRFQALAIKGSPRFVTGDALTPGKRHAVEWLDVPVEAGEREDGLRMAAQERGAASVRRGEGIWRGEDGFYVTASTGGPVAGGQILRLSPDGSALELLIQADDGVPFDMPDNLTVTPWGDLLVCEDNQRDEHLWLITRRGRVVLLAHNALSRSELAGVCVSPRGRFVFVNIQENGLTLALEGPFQKLAAS